MTIDLTTAAVGDKIKFVEEKATYTVQARSERYVICSKPFNLKGTVIYTIVDLKEGIRGPDSNVFGLSYESRKVREARLAE